MERNKSSVEIKQEAIAKFQSSHIALRNNPDIMKDFKLYDKEVRQLKKKIIKELKEKRVPGTLRSKVNDIMQHATNDSHRRFLYFKDPNCQLCHKPIEHYRDTTIDHIVPRSLGGENAFYNKQLAHMRCNSRKSNKVDFN